MPFLATFLFNALAVTQGTNLGVPFLHSFEDAMHDDDLDALVEIATRPRNRAELEAEFGRVWDADELAQEFVVTAIIAPTYIVRRKSDGVIGSVLCQPRTKLFFNFRPSPPADPAEAERLKWHDSTNTPLLNA